MKISQKLTLGFLSTALLVAVVGYISIDASQKALQESIGEQSAALAAKMLEHIDRCIYNRIETFQEYSKDLITQRVISESNEEFEKLDNIQAYISEKDREWTSVPKEEVTAFMQKLINNELSEELREKISFYEAKYGYRVFGEVFVTNKYGANTAQTGKTTDYYQADEQWWQMAKKDGLYVADVEYDRSANVYSTDICIRIDDRKGNFLGVIKVVLNIEETISFIKKSETPEEHRALQFKLLAKDGKIIYATEEFEFLQNLPLELSSLLHPEEKDEHAHKSYFIAAGDKPGEGEELFAHVHSKGYEGYKGLGWILVVELDTDEVFTPVAELRTHILIISLVVTILAVLLGFFISKTISEPLRKLAIAAAEIGTGKLDTGLEVKSNDEVGQLATSFNKMAKDLQGTTTSIDNLNREVAERKQAEESLRESEGKMSAMLQSLGDHMSMMDKDLNVLWANEVAKGLFGDEIIGKKCYEVYHGRDNPCEPSPCLTLKAFEDGQIHEHEIQVKCTDGRILNYACTASAALRDDEGNPTTVIEVSRDITERKQAEAELKAAQEKLIDTAHRAGMAEVAADVLHNVGNVLNSINVSTTVIKEKVSNSEVANLEKVASIINEHTDDLGTFLTEDPQGKHIPVYLTEVSKCLQNEQTDIISRLWALADNVQHIKDIVSTQQSYAKVSGVEVQTSLSKLAEDAIQINSAGLERHGTQLIREFEELGDVEIDKQKLLQILVNLVSNAKYALSGSKREEKLLTIRIYKHGEDRFRIEVADNGVGISEDNLAKIFSYGFTTKKDGNGVGLHSSALAAKEMGGTLSVYSDGLGQGATFTLELPFKSVEVMK